MENTDKFYKVKVYEQPYKHPINLDQASANLNPKEIRLPDRDSIVSGKIVDKVRIKVRNYVENDMKRVVRSINFGVDKISKEPMIFVVVYNLTEVKDNRVVSENRLKRVL
jgi:hypothetical protein